MYCKKCGAELLDDATFCVKCGAQIKNENKEDAKIEKVASVPEKKAAKISLGQIIAGVAVIVVGIIFILSVNIAGKTVKLNDYIKVSFEGYETRGRARVDFNEERFEEKYKSKIKASKDNDDIFAFISPVEFLYEEIDYDLDKSSGLSNGDKVTLKWNVDPKEIKKDFGLIIKTEDVSYEVSGLKRATTFDPFVGVDISFYGTAPNGQCEITNCPSDNGLYYSLDESYGLSNGDTVTVKVSYPGSEDSYVERTGMLPSSMTKGFSVSGLEEWVTSYADMDENFIASMKKEAEDTILAYAAKSFKTSRKLDSNEYMGYIFLGTKPGESYWFIHNCLYVIYKATISSPSGAFENTTFYYPVRFDNIKRTTAGVNYEACSGIQGSTNFASFYDVSGYLNPLLLYEKLGVSDEANYMVEYGDGFAIYKESKLVTKLEDINKEFLSEIEEKAKNAINKNVSERNYSWSKDFEVKNVEVKGQYLISKKKPNSDYVDNNALFVILRVDLTSNAKNFGPYTVYFAYEVDGIMSLRNQCMSTKMKGLRGSTKFDDYSRLNCYMDGVQMYNDIIVANKDQYNYVVSDGLKEFGE